MADNNDNGGSFTLGFILGGIVGGLAAMTLMRLTHDRSTILSCLSEKSAPLLSPSPGLTQLGRFNSDIQVGPSNEESESAPHGNSNDCQRRAPRSFQEYSEERRYGCISILTNPAGSFL